MTDQKEMENVEYFNYPGNLITNDARHTHKIKSRIALARTALYKKKLFTSKSDLNLRIQRNATLGAQLCVALNLGTLQKVHQKYIKRFEMWCCRRTEMISWTDYVKNEEVLQRVK
jgi:hypothetical protein